MIHIIVAMSPNGVIGDKGKLLWNLKEDMKLFKELTENNIVIMGRKTWDSLPEKFKPLPNRKNIVISSTLTRIDGAEIASNVDDAINMARSNAGQIYCIGGGQVYEEFLPKTDYLHISFLKKEYEGDTKFPKIDFSKWKVIEEKEFIDFTYKKFEKNI